jgi:hypothetical protein
MVSSGTSWWTKEELVKLNEAVAVHGTKNWNLVSQHVGRIGE